MKYKWSILAFVSVLILTIVCTNRIGRKSEDEQKQVLQEAITKSIVQCYALEGKYPSDLEYLEKEYGVLIDHDKYFVHYEYIASNIMPTIVVVYKTWEG